MRPWLLILRPEPGATATSALARAAGYESVIAPLFEIAALPWISPDSDDHDAVMMTSANAARVAGARLSVFYDRPLYAVGKATAAAAGAAGFRDIRTGDRDVAALIDRARADGIRRLLHIAGADHIAADAGPIRIDRIIAYASVDRPQALAALPDHAMIALVHSPRAAERFANLVVDRSRFCVAAISPAALRAAGSGWRAGAAAELPNDAALLAVAARLCDEWH